MATGFRAALWVLGLVGAPPEAPPTAGFRLPGRLGLSGGGGAPEPSAAGAAFRPIFRPRRR